MREALPGFYPSKGFRSTTMLFLTRCSPHVTTTPSRERRYRTSRVLVNAGVAAQPGMEERSSESVFAIGLRRQNRSNAPCALSSKRELWQPAECSRQDAAFACGLRRAFARRRILPSDIERAFPIQ